MSITRRFFLGLLSAIGVLPASPPDAFAVYGVKPPKRFKVGIPLRSHIYTVWEATLEDAERVPYAANVLFVRNERGDLVSARDALLSAGKLRKADPDGPHIPYTSLATRVTL